MGEKHWTLKGEVSSKSRPLNSLLEEDLDYEHATKVPNTALIPRFVHFDNTDLPGVLYRLSLLSQTRSRKPWRR